MIHKRHLVTENARPCLGMDPICAYHQVAAGGRAVGESDGGCLAVYFGDGAAGMDLDGESRLIGRCGLVLESVVQVNA